MGNLWDGAACMELDRHLAARGIRFSPPTLGTTIGNPPGKGHTSGSNHYPEFWEGRRIGPVGSTGQARDYGTYGSDCNAIAEEFEQYARGPNYIISELIWTRRLPRTGIYYKRGVAYTPSLLLAWQHRNHDHVAIAVGRHLPTAGVVPKPPISLGEFLMSLTDKQQQEMYDRLFNVHEWSKPDGPWEKSDKDRLVALEKAVGSISALLLKWAQAGKITT